jgi:hypothetical protein
MFILILSSDIYLDLSKGLTPWGSLSIFIKIYIYMEFWAFFVDWNSVRIEAPMEVYFHSFDDLSFL